MLNPITYTEHVVDDFLRYQMTTHSLADRGLRSQLRHLLNLDETRNSPLLKGPYFTLSKSFRRGASFTDLGRQGILHPHIARLAGHDHAYGHQEAAFRAIAAGKTTVVSTGTGSGKTECFLYPVISRALQLRDQHAAPGISAVLVYPMNALAEDQLGRLRELLAGTGVTFGMYVGKTPRERRDVAGDRLPANSSREAYRQRVAEFAARRDSRPVHPAEERVSREEMRTPGQQPRILLTNVKQLELLLTRQQDAELFDGARLDFLVFDEAHTFSGAMGAETACLVRRLRTYCGRRHHETVCVATSATIADRTGGDAGRDFAVRFFGVAADNVELVREDYEPDAWQDQRVAMELTPGSRVEQLHQVFDAIEAADREDPPPEADAQLRVAVATTLGRSLGNGDWQLELFRLLSGCQTVWQLANIMDRPRALPELLGELSTRLDRAVTEEEVLIWLALGAAARNEERPLLRPVVHGFVRGIDGAVVTFPQARQPVLWLSAMSAEQAGDTSCRLPVLACTTCGQHYFEHHVDGLDVTGGRLGGGQATSGGVVWAPVPAGEPSNRVLLTDGLAVDELDDDSDDGSAVGPWTGQPVRRTLQVGFCRACGALQNQRDGACLACGRPDSVTWLLAIQQGPARRGKLTSCVGCGAIGGERMGRWREPCKPLRATAVADVHVLAQNMLQYADRRRLLVFADNRQDAAFQAGWMRDHARRYRIRSLIFDQLGQGPRTLGDTVFALEAALDADDDLSKSLLPEVWAVHRKEDKGRAHQDERRTFLRILVLLEATTGPRQAIGLEPWGRLRVDYDGLDRASPFYDKWVPRLRRGRDELQLWVECLLDVLRRKRILWDPEVQLFSRTWSEADPIVANGYIGGQDVRPVGLKLRRVAGDSTVWVQQLLASRGDTQARQMLDKFAAATSVNVPEFFSDLWDYLTKDVHLLEFVTLKGRRNSPLPGTSDTVQLAVDRILLRAHRGIWRCLRCRKTFSRPTPAGLCIGWRCSGEVRQEQEDADDYDLRVLDGQFVMLRPREHSAQIPQDDREVIERMFKGGHDQVNTLVATPTLELGVDIGALDVVLMRNVPPAAANYWQRAGRAGRRHRMAVNLTYARPASHDRSYFAEPLKLLQGRVAPPSFNLRNQLMVTKHAHAVVLSELRKIRNEQGLSQEAKARIQAALDGGFPRHVSTYLFDAEGNVRATSYDLGPLAAVIAEHRDRLMAAIRSVFDSQWPAQDRQALAPAILDAALDGLPGALLGIVNALRRRLRWAMDQKDRLHAQAQRRGTLEPDEDALARRCDDLIKRLKGEKQRRGNDSEGVDDTETFGVLALEGLLPGYGLDIGSISVTHMRPARSNQVDLREWSLRRAHAMALREHVPGNLIYANNHRFTPRFFHLDPVDPTVFQVDMASEAIGEVGVAAGMATLNAGTVAALPVCDVDLSHMSSISDDEDFRFQLAVTVLGHELGRHGDGQMWTWGSRQLSVRHNVHLRLVNVGPASATRQGNFGYPVCCVCGASRSPFASLAEQAKFAEVHKERCRVPVVRTVNSQGATVEVVRPLGLFADIVADALCIQGCEGRTEAYSIMESLRKGAAEVLEMEVEDLQVLVIGRAGLTAVDGLLYDPMPGGSGLLQQMVARWPEVVAAATAILAGCEADCATSCIDCLQHFRNAFYHQYLDRHVALAAFDVAGSALVFSHDVPPQMPQAPATDGPVNEGERTLQFLLERAGFPAGEYNRRIDLGGRYGATIPDVFYPDPTGRYQGICLYKDGMGRRLHGDPERSRIDAQIRDELDVLGYQVRSITETELTDRESLRRLYQWLGRRLLDDATRQALERGWQSDV